MKTYFKWDDTNNTLEYDGVNCSFGDNDSYCDAGFVYVGAYSYGYFEANDHVANFYCSVESDGFDCYWD